METILGMTEIPGMTEISEITGIKAVAAARNKKYRLIPLFMEPSRFAARPLFSEIALIYGSLTPPFIFYSLLFYSFIFHSFIFNSAPNIGEAANSWSVKFPFFSSLYFHFFVF